MRRSLLSGLVLAVVAALVVLLGEAVGLELENIALVGIAIGAVLALGPGRSELGKLGAFAGGFVVAWIAYALRAAVLPDSPGGRAVAIFLVIAVVTAVCSLFEASAPTWGALLGAAALSAAYEQTYTAAPSQFLRESPTAATSVLLTAAVGYLVVLALSPRERVLVATHGRRDAEGDETRLDDMLAGEKR